MMTGMWTPHAELVPRASCASNLVRLLMLWLGSVIHFDDRTTDVTDRYGHRCRGDAQGGRARGESGVLDSVILPVSLSLQHCAMLRKKQRACAAAFVLASGSLR